MQTNVWGYALKLAPKLPSPGNWGWIQDVMGVWKLHWTELAEAIKTLCHELIHCECRKCCRENVCSSKNYSNALEIANINIA